MLSGCLKDFIAMIGFQQFDYDVPRHSFLYILTIQDLLSFLDMWVFVFIFSKNFGYYFQNIFYSRLHFLLLLELQLHMCVGLFDFFPYNSLRICLFFFFHFSFCSSDSIISMSYSAYSFFTQEKVSLLPFPRSQCITKLELCFS